MDSDVVSHNVYIVRYIQYSAQHILNVIYAYKSQIFTLKFIQPYDMHYTTIWYVLHI